jgi:hypothetical protein
VDNFTKAMRRMEQQPIPALEIVKELTTPATNGGKL